MRMIDIYIRLSDAEQRALNRHLNNIAYGDKHRRRKALKEYNAFLDYLEASGRITEPERVKMEYFRLERRHVELEDRYER